jgi:bacterioferritin-associated ferredoxin
MPDRDGQIIVCRCEEVTMDRIRHWIDEGYDTINELKRALRVCMGPCQGRGCRDIIMRELSRKTGKPLDEVDPGSMRPVVKPIKIGLIAGDAE